MTHFKYINLNKAVQITKSHSKNLQKTSQIDLGQSLNYISSKNIHSPIFLPQLDSAGLDGFIFSSKRYAKIPISSQIIETGKAYKKLDIKFAYKINTGASMPSKFKNFISIENAFIENDHLILTKSKISNKDIKKKGEDLKKKQLLIKKSKN